MKQLPVEAYENVASFEAKMGTPSQTKDGEWRINLLVKSADVPFWFIHSYPGMHVAVGMKVVQHDGTIAESKQDAMVASAGRLCRDEQFREFLVLYAKRNCGMTPPASLGTEDDAAEILRECLGVTSRSDLRTNTAARANFRSIVRSYEGWLMQKAGGR